MNYKKLKRFSQRLYTSPSIGKKYTEIKQDVLPLETESSNNHYYLYLLVLVLLLYTYFKS